MRSNRIQAVSPVLAELKREHQAQQEIENFLKAIKSYPESFAHDPSLSFEEHLFTVIAQNQELHLA
jgi:hypothetical protein